MPIIPNLSDPIPMGGSILMGGKDNKPRRKLPCQKIDSKAQFLFSVFRVEKTEIARLRLSTELSGGVLSPERRSTRPWPQKPFAVLLCFTALSIAIHIKNTNINTVIILLYIYISLFKVKEKKKDIYIYSYST